MTDINTYQGKVTEYQEPKGRGPHRFTISQGDSNGYEKSRKFRVWDTDYKTKEHNPDVDMMKNAYAGAQVVSVDFYTKEGKFEGKTFPENYITSVEFVGGGTVEAARPGSAPPTKSVDELASLFTVLEGALEDALATLKQIRGSDAAPADDGW